MRARSKNVMPYNFEEWIRNTFGEGISRVFMHPYNRKVWAVPLSLMGYGWTGDRVSIPDVDQPKKQGLSDFRGTDWGLNHLFSYPLRGGIGEIFRRLSDRVKGHLLTDHEVMRVDPSRRMVLTQNGGAVVYNYLLNTSPLNRFVRKVMAPIPSVIADAGALLKHNSMGVIGVGLHGVTDKKTNWMYFPETVYPFYRVTNLHTYSPHMTPESDCYSAVMAEVSYPVQNAIDTREVENSVVQGMIDAGLIGEEMTGNIVSRWQRTLE